jgi:hypothetical protein
VSGGKHSQNGSLFTSPDSHLGAGSAQQAWQAQADHPADPAAEYGLDRPAEPQADRRAETLPLPAMDVLGQRRE